MIPARAALLLIDLQKAIDHPDWGAVGPRNNQSAEAAGSALLAAWRAAGGPIVHVRHDSVEPQSHYRPGQPLHEFKPEFVPRDTELIVGKKTGSAFVGTGLEDYLRGRGLNTLVVFGVVTNNSVEATVRHAGCLGFQVLLVEDACFTFARKDWNGVLRTAEEVHALSLANLHGEYCKVTHSHSIVPGGL